MFCAKHWLPPPVLTSVSRNDLACAIHHKTLHMETRLPHGICLKFHIFCLSWNDIWRRNTSIYHILFYRFINRVYIDHYPRSQCIRVSLYGCLTVTIAPIYWFVLTSEVLHPWLGPPLGWSGWGITPVARSSSRMIRMRYYTRGSVLL